MSYSYIKSLVDSGAFENQVPYPTREDYPNNDARMAALKAYREGMGSANKRFRDALEEEFGTADNPKADDLWRLAWEHGHSSGYMEVLHYYEEFVVLVE